MSRFWQSRYFSARYWRARFWHGVDGDVPPTPTLPVPKEGWVTEVSSNRRVWIVKRKRR